MDWKGLLAWPPGPGSRLAIGMSRDIVPEDGIGRELNLPCLLRGERAQEFFQLVGKQSRGWGALGRRPQIEMFQDLADDPRLLDESHSFHSATAIGASERIDFIDFAQESSPVGPASFRGRFACTMCGGRPARYRIGAVLALASFAPSGVGVEAIVADHLLPRVGNVRGDQGDPVQGIHRAGEAFTGTVLDLTGGGGIVHSSGREAGAEKVGSQTFYRGSILGLDRCAAVDVKSAVAPSPQLFSEIWAETPLLDQHPEHLMLKKGAKNSPLGFTQRGVDSIFVPSAVTDERMQVGVRVELVAISLNGEDGGRNSLPAQGTLIIEMQTSPGTATQFA